MKAKSEETSKDSTKAVDMAKETDTASGYTKVKGDLDYCDDERNKDRMKQG